MKRFLLSKVFTLIYFFVLYLPCTAITVSKESAKTSEGNQASGANTESGASQESKIPFEKELPSGWHALPEIHYVIQKKSHPFRIVSIAGDLEDLGLQKYRALGQYVIKSETRQKNMAKLDRVSKEAISVMMLEFLKMYYMRAAANFLIPSRNPGWQLPSEIATGTIIGLPIMQEKFDSLRKRQKAFSSMQSTQTKKKSATTLKKRQGDSVYAGRFGTPKMYAGINMDKHFLDEFARVW